MKATELMINDWVQVPCLIDNVEHYDAWCKVKQLRDCDLDVIGFKELKYNEIVPIPLTTEILEQNGFERVNGDYQDVFYVYDGIELLIDDGYTLFGQCKMQIMYVHELQHALRLCGINKEIII